MSARIGIADYGVGNLRSVANAIKATGGEPFLEADPAALKNYDKVILPGVGAFGDAIACLRNTGMADALTELVEQGKPTLGICLGMQLMCTDSEEGGFFQGLNWFPAHVRLFPARLGVKVPQIGWNNLEFTQDHFLFNGLKNGCDVYFVHSYRVECENSTHALALCDYGEPYAAVIGRDNVWGFQFHPEKSQRVGLAMLKNFIESSCL